MRESVPAASVLMQRRSATRCFLSSEAPACSGRTYNNLFNHVFAHCSFYLRIELCRHDVDEKVFQLVFVHSFCCPKPFQHGAWQPHCNIFTLISTPTLLNSSLFYIMCGGREHDIFVCICIYGKGRCCQMKVLKNAVRKRYQARVRLTQPRTAKDNLASVKRASTDNGGWCKCMYVS